MTFFTLNCPNGSLAKNHSIHKHLKNHDQMISKWQMVHRCQRSQDFINVQIAQVTMHEHIPDGKFYMNGAARKTRLNFVPRK